MDAALERLGWTEDHWNRICTTVTEEAQRTRVAAQILPVVGPEDPSTVAVPAYRVTYPPRAVPPPNRQMEVSSDPTLYLTSISVLVELRGREGAESSLAAALTMFRRAANVVARAEDALVFNGRSAARIRRVGRLPRIFGVNQLGAGIRGLLASPTVVPIPPPQGGTEIATAIIQAIGALDQAGFTGPYACALDQAAFDAICGPLATLVLPRDRVLPFLQGGSLVRASAIPPRLLGVRGAVVALSGDPVELVVAKDINVTYLQTTGALDPRHVFRVSERVALRVKQRRAIAIIT
jgi:uncharacterized linocin/CFP29 family protein